MKLVLFNSKVQFKSFIILPSTKVLNKYVDNSGNLQVDDQNKFCYYDITILDGVDYLMVINTGAKASILYAQFFDENNQKVGSAFQAIDCSCISIPSGATSIKWSGRYDSTGEAFVTSFVQDAASGTELNTAIRATDGVLISDSNTYVSKYSLTGTKVDIYVPLGTVERARICFYDSNNNKVGNVITNITSGKTTYDVPSNATQVFVQCGTSFFVVVHN